MKKSFCLLLLFIVLLTSACSPKVTQSAPSAIVATVFIPKATQTSEPIPSLTAASTSTEFSSTPTFDVAKILTFTPAPYSECPTTNADLRFPKPGKVKDHLQETEEIKNNITDFLNKGGTLKAAYDGLAKFMPDAKVFTIDVTNDKTPELFLEANSSLFVFGCNRGKYETIFERTFQNQGQPSSFEFTYIKDINLNSIPEIIIKENALAMNPFDGAFGCFAYYIYEWDGSQFNDLVSQEQVSFGDQIDIRKNSSDSYPSNGIFSCGTFVSVDESTHNKFEVKDTNQDSLAEIIIVSGVDVPEPNLGLIPSPEKQVILTLSWNGQFYTPVKVAYKSIYRIHVAIDGDIAFKEGNYEQAIGLYQMAIDNSKLIDEPLPPKLDTEQPDFITGHKQVVAYAYFRKMLTKAAQDQVNDVNLIYGNIQNKFLNDESTKPFAEMATEFWNEYERSNNPTGSCEKVSNYVTTHKDILRLFEFMGKGAYTAEDICPIQ